VIIPDATIGTAQLRTGFSLARSDSSQKGSIVKWYPVLSKTGAEIFLADTGDAQTIGALEAYPTGADADGYRLPYDISEYSGTGKLLSVENPRLEYTPSDLAVTVHSEFGQDDCSAYLTSISSNDQTITRFAVVADIWYRGSSYSQQIVPGTKPKTYTAKVLSDAGSALRLARILASRQTFAQQSYGFDSALVMDPGTVVRVIEDKVSFLDIMVRILSREFDISTGLYRYTGEGVSAIDLTAAVESIDRAENALGKPRKGDEGEDAISVQILSLNGNQFRVGTCNTTLIASVWKGSEEITGTLDDSAFTWNRTSTDFVADAAWNTSSKAIGHKSIGLTSEDVSGRAVFGCNVEI